MCLNHEHFLLYFRFGEAKHPVKMVLAEKDATESLQRAPSLLQLQEYSVQEARRDLKLRTQNGLDVGFGPKGNPGRRLCLWDRGKQDNEPEIITEVPHDCMQHHPQDPS